MRISRERMYMDIAQAFAKRSTCFRNNVGAVIVRTGDWVINGTGYNGPPAGDEHCRGNDCDFLPNQGCRRAIHAEINALDRMETIALQGPQWLFTTRSPCIECAIAIRACGAIQRVYYEEPYRNPQSLDMLNDEGVRCYRVMPSGYIVDPRNSMIVVGE